MSKKLERADLVHTVKALNTALKLNPPLRTKKGDVFVAEDDIKEMIVKTVKGWDEEKKAFVKANAVNRDDVKLDDKSWEVIDILTAKGKKEEKPAKKGEKSESPLKSPNKEKSLRAPKEARSAGRFPTEWEALKAHIDGLQGNVSLARDYDKQLAVKCTLAEHLKAAEKIQKTHGVQRSIIPHIKWRIENDGWLFKDTRKFQHDEDGIVCLIGCDPSRAKKCKFDMPLKASAPAKKEKKQEAPKVEKKADKKSEKNEKAEKSDKKVSKAK